MGKPGRLSQLQLQLQLADVQDCLIPARGSSNAPAYLLKMKRALFLFFALLLSSANAAFAARLSVPIMLDAADLQDGAKYQYEVRAYYLFIKMEQGRITDEMLADGIMAPEVFRGTFSAPRGANAEISESTFHFASDPPAPPGMTAVIVFKTNITITPPASSGRPPMSRQRIYGGPRVTDKIGQYCLRIRGPIASGSFYLGVSDCDDPITAVPKK
jgi:hypothetical protein